MFTVLTTPFRRLWAALSPAPAAPNLRRLYRESAADPEPWDEAAHPHIEGITRSRHAGARQTVTASARRREAKRARQLRKHGRRAGRRA